MTPRSARPCFAACALATVGMLAARPAAAVEAYVATGFPYLLVGVAQPINANFGVRADFGTIAHHGYSGTTSDNDFKGSINYSRTALLADWYVAGGGFRLTGGAAFNQAKATMTASAHDGKISIGGQQYDAPSNLYYVQSDLSFPKAAPYIGLGWGHHDAPAGLSFNFDLGAAIGTAKATPLKASPALASELAVNQQGAADLASENKDFQDTVRKFKAIPQLTVGRRLPLLSLGGVEFRGERLHHVARAGLVGRAHHVVHVARAHEGVDVRFVRLRRHRVAQEDHRVDTALREARADLQVAAQRAAEEALHLQAGFGDQARAGGAGGHHVAARKERGEVPRERDHQVLLGVVRDQGDVHRAIISTRSYGVRSFRMPQSEARTLRMLTRRRPHSRHPETTKREPGPRFAVAFAANRATRPAPTRAEGPVSSGTNRPWAGCRLAVALREALFAWRLEPAARASSDVNWCALPLACAARPPWLAISRWRSRSMPAKPRPPLGWPPCWPWAPAWFC